MTNFLQTLNSGNRISRIVLFGCALVLGGVATASLPQRANAQPALFSTSKEICIGVPNPISNDPNTCPHAAFVGVGQQMFYVIKVTNPPGQPQQQITLTENSAGSSTGYPTGFVPGAISCTDQTTGASPLFLIVASPVISFQLPMATTVTCTI